MLSNRLDFCFAISLSVFAVSLDVFFCITRDIYFRRIIEIIHTDWTLPWTLLEQALQLRASVGPPFQPRLCYLLSLRRPFSMCIPQFKYFLSSTFFFMSPFIAFF